jgi:GntR family transcriptional regulator
MIEFQLDETSGVATYLQLVQQVHQALRMGMLEPGDQLPTAQQVVARLATQARFLAELAGWMRSARSAGLGPDDIEAIYRTAFRTCFAEGVA